MKMFLVLIAVLFVSLTVVKADQVLDENIVARTLLAEAKGEGSNGLYAVACVIQQRTIERHLTPAQVCLQRLQFSCWNKANANDRQFKSLKNNQLADYAKGLAANVVTGKKLDRSKVGFANSYCALGCYPNWSWKLWRVATVGGHKFFKV